jgi:hypothetical protein
MELYDAATRHRIDGTQARDDRMGREAGGKDDRNGASLVISQP